MASQDTPTPVTNQGLQETPTLVTNRGSLGGRSTRGVNFKTPTPVTPTPITNRGSLGGRSRGGVNFKSTEDICLAKAFVVVSSNIVVDTDQNLTNFWIKIKKVFNEIIGDGFLVDRTHSSLKNHWNNTI